MSTLALPLCSICAAAQLHDRWQEAKADAAAWKYAEDASLPLAVVVAVVALVIDSWPAAGIAGGLALSTFAFALGHERALRKRRQAP
jgi:hypothetical protein